MAVEVLKPGSSGAPLGVLRRVHHGCPCSDRLIEQLIDVVVNDVEAGRGSRPMRAVAAHDHGISSPELDVHDAAVDGVLLGDEVEAQPVDE